MSNKEKSVHVGEECFQQHGPTLMFSNIKYCIQERVGLLCKKGPEKVILKDISGILKPGMNAIMGPTGSGKTSLLDVIAGRKDPAGLRHGTVFVDGRPVTNDLRLTSAYVVQDDVLMGTLSVRENLLFSANLRLDPKNHSSADKQSRVENILEELGLTECANTKIGTDFIRGVSGGERKRCSIGMELITAPSLLFLDEPTTGLDAYTANCIISLLHKLSRNGKTVIFSIHQPRYSIFEQFDQLTLMHKGDVVYAGKADKALEYFSLLGYQIKAFNNPADFFLDIINGEAESTLELPATDGNNPLLVQFRKSPQCQQEFEEVEQVCQAFEGGLKTKGEKVDYVTSFFYQMRILSHRAVLNLLRTPQTSYAQWALTVFFALLVGLIYYQIPLTLPEGLQNRSGAFFFLVINVVFSNLGAVELFIKERSVFIHENANGYYRTSVYFLSKIGADLLPNRIVPNIFFSAISYYMMGLKPAFLSFLCFTLTMTLTSIGAVSVAFMVSATVNSLAMANLLVALPFVIMMVFGGFLVNLNNMLSWLSWLEWISIFKYGMNAMFITEMTGQPHARMHKIDPFKNQNIRQGIDYSRWGFWQNQVALIGISSVCLVVAYIQLRRIKRWK
uniref:ABC transporter domain-containing protein n=1 Tax=Gadus morhua TaxID=8049 RepID=A0A8C5AM11_GADMO